MSQEASEQTGSTRPPFEAYDGTEPYVFVSYAHRDSASVYPELSRLHSLGYRIWYDEGIDPGNEWPEEIATALQGCAFLVVFISPRAVESKNVRNEVNFAIARHKPFLAVHLEETALPAGLELQMGSIQAVMRYRMPPNRYARKIEKTLPRNVLGKEPAEPSGHTAPTQTDAPQPIPQTVPPEPERKPLPEHPVPDCRHGYVRVPRHLPDKPKAKLATGIDVGAQAVKVVSLEAQGPNVNLVGFAHHPFNCSLSHTTDDVDEIVRTELANCRASIGSVRGPVFASLSGSTYVMYRAIEAPAGYLERNAGRRDAFKAVAEYEIPFPLDVMAWDHQVFRKADRASGNLALTAIRKEAQARDVSNLTGAGLKVKGLTSSLLAVCNAMIYDLSLTPESDGVILLDVGAHKTDIAVIHKGNVELRQSPIGGDTFTEAIAKTFNLPFAKAERVKLSAASSKHARQILRAMRRAFADFVNRIQLYVRHYVSLHRNTSFERIIALGKGLHLVGLQKFTQGKLGLGLATEMTKLEGFNRLSIPPTFAERFRPLAGQFATAYGLALQGLGLAPLEFNLMPKRSTFLSRVLGR